MNKSLFTKEVEPFLLTFAALIAGTIIFDGVLHLFDMVWVGRWLGIPGTFLILLSFIYSLRKRQKIRFGRPALLLKLHEVLTLAGVLMILVHAGIHVYAILPWLALVAMLVNVVSGMTGQYLLARSRRFLTEKKSKYREQGLDAESIEKELFWDSVTFDLMNRWRAIHIPITLVFVVLALAHILSILMFWQWR